MFSRCAVCSRMLLPPEENRTVCSDCARKSGAIALPPPRRRAAPCTKCNHTKLVRVIPREIGAEGTGPMFATYHFPVNPLYGLGVFETYICKRCGFVEWYCQAPEEIPIGPEYMSEDVDVGGDGPYR